MSPASQEKRTQLTIYNTEKDWSVGTSLFSLPASGQPATRICQSRNTATVFCWDLFEFVLNSFWFVLFWKNSLLKSKQGNKSIRFEHRICLAVHRLEWMKPSCSKGWTFKRSQTIELHMAWQSNLTGWNDLKRLVWLKRDDPNEDVFQSEQEAV